MFKKYNLGTFIIILLVLSPLLMNSIRSTVIESTTGLSQSYKLDQNKNLPPFYGLCLYEIDEIDKWSEQINDKIIRFRSSNSNDIKCLGRIIGSSEEQGKSLDMINKTYIDIYVAKNLPLEYSFKFSIILIIYFLTQKLFGSSREFLFFSLLFLISYQLTYEPQAFNYNLNPNILEHFFNVTDFYCLAFIILLIQYKSSYLNFNFSEKSINELKYRPEVDTLRAISVLGVLFYHTEYFSLQGGYLGVDVFFVISGYLISYKIIEQLISENFSFKEFYLRRVKRILPASIASLFLFFPFAYYLLIPKRMIEFLDSVISSNFFFSNFYFMNSGNYNSAPSKITPFINMWSLSVEEQYYIVFPLIFYFIFKKFKNYTKPLFYSLLFIAFYFAISYESTDEATYFYMLQYRIWEFLAGTLVALVFISNQNKLLNFVKKYRFVGAVGFFGILISFVSFNDLVLNSFYPNFIVVIFSCIYLLFTGTNSTMKNLFTNRSLLMIGKVSFSLYLIHQPLFAFYRIYKYRNVSVYEEAFLITVSLILSYFMWKFIEQKFRYDFTLKTLFSFISLISILNIFIYSYGNDQGFINRYSNFSEDLLEELLIGEKSGVFNEDGEPCFNLECDFNFGNDQYLVLIGDSHIGRIAKQVKSYSQKNNYNYHSFIQGGCVFTKESYAQKYGCQFNNNDTFESIKKLNPKIIIYGARLPVYVNGTCMDTGKYVEKNCGGYYLNNSVPNLSPEESLPYVISDIQSTIYELSKITDYLVLLYPIPNHAQDTNEIILRNKLSNESLSYPRTVWQDRVEFSTKVYDEILGNNIIRIYPEKLFCNQFIKDECVAKIGSQIFYSDGNHLSTTGAELFTDYLFLEMNNEELSFKK